MSLQHSDYQEKTKLPWVPPQLIFIDVNFIHQQALEQEAALLNWLANDENAFRLFTGSTG